MSILSSLLFAVARPLGPTTFAAPALLLFPLQFGNKAKASLFGARQCVRMPAHASDALCAFEFIRDGQREGARACIRHAWCLLHLAAQRRCSCGRL
eukprot:58473-Pleurochrysis_carterae.AAC.1